ncbi:MAG: hypothetical protein IK066_10320, partial [Kiritimatiellae bacterium]|nr:hypothetical protein [Kiritimatiellia bacterium]
SQISVQRTRRCIVTIGEYVRMAENPQNLEISGKTHISYITKMRSYGSMRSASRADLSELQFVRFPWHSILPQVWNSTGGGRLATHWIHGGLEEGMVGFD